MMAIVLVFQNPGQTWEIADALFYQKPLVNPPVFQEFLSTPAMVANGTAIADLGDLVLAFGATLPESVDR